MLEYAPLIAGILLLLLGRRLFWVYVGAVGFVVGLEAAKKFLPGDSAVLILGTATGLGVLGVIFALFFQKMAVGSAGFLAGGYIAFTLCGRLAWLSPDQTWLAFPVGGVIGGLLAVWLFEWAMIFLSSLLGALLITEPLGVSEELKFVGSAILAVLGILLQGGFLKARPAPPAKK